jgi:methylated-DNA-[protein]-cysteine S-methyltransferase
MNRDDKLCVLERIELETKIGVMDITFCFNGLHVISLKQINELNEKHSNKLIYSDRLKTGESKSINECIEYFNNYFAKKTDLLRETLPRICWRSICEPNTFVERVLKELYKSDFGQTLSYKHLAELAGNSNAYRAVGTAMRKNRIPFIIPCHRVVNSDGSIGNYSLGIHFKKYLLEHEKS